MKSKSFNSLSFILISAVVLFVIAIIWKFTQVDNSEPISVQTTQKIKKVNPVRNIDLTTSEPKSKPIAAVNVTKPERPVLDSREKINKYYKANYLLSQLRTPEALEKAYKKYEKEGNYDMADQVLNKLASVFPDYDIND